MEDVKIRRLLVTQEEFKTKTKTTHSGTSNCDTMLPLRDSTPPKVFIFIFMIPYIFPRPNLTVIHPRSHFILKKKKGTADPDYLSIWQLTTPNHKPLYKQQLDHQGQQSDWKALIGQEEVIIQATGECTNMQQPFLLSVIGRLLNAPQLRPQCEGLQPQHIPP